MLRTFQMTLVVGTIARFEVRPYHISETLQRFYNRVSGNRKRF